MGSNVLSAGPRSTGQTLAKILVTNYPGTGPVFSGPHQTPFVCETDFQGLGPPLDPDCSAPTRVDYYYRSTTTNSFQPFNTAGPRPADLAMTTTNEGLTVPYIVRREMGTINRAVYMVAILHDPTLPLSDPFTRTSGYNGRLIYSFGGGCQAGYHQGRSVGGMSAATFNLEDTGAAFHDVFLAKGYAVIGGSLNVTGTSCADLISAETAEMIKEHFIEEFGPPRYTIGHGASGGSMQQHLLGNNYPISGRHHPGQKLSDMMSSSIRFSIVSCLSRSTRRHCRGRTRKRRRCRLHDFGDRSNGTRYEPAREELQRGVDPARACLRPRDQLAWSALHVPGQPRERLRHRSCHGICPASLRQRRDPIRAGGAQCGSHQLRPVHRSQRAGWRARHRR
jgi:hypothetical protein